MDGPAAPFESPWPLAVHGAMLRDVPAREAVELLTHHGFRGIYCELPAGRTDAPDLPDLMGVSVTSLGFAPDDLNQVEPARAAELAEVLHASSVRVCGASMAGQSYKAAYEATLRTCEAYSRAARKRGLRTLLHQRWGTVTASASQLYRVLEHFDPREVGCVYDAGSMTVEGHEEYRIGLEILGSYVADVHIANTRHFPSTRVAAVWEWEWSPLSDGVLDLQRLARALRRAHYEGWITLADRSEGRPPRRCSQADRRMLQQAFDDLEGIGSHNPVAAPGRSRRSLRGPTARAARWMTEQALGGVGHAR